MRNLTSFSPGFDSNIRFPRVALPEVKAAVFDPLTYEFGATAVANIDPVLMLSTISFDLSLTDNFININNCKMDGIFEVASTGDISEG